MDSETLKQAWVEICSQVKTYPNVDSSQIDAFFSRLQPQAMSDGFLMLTADNDFIKTWIERHYLALIHQALQDIYQTSFTVIIEVNAQASVNNPLATSQQSVDKDIQNTAEEVIQQNKTEEIEIADNSEPLLEEAPFVPKNKGENKLNNSHKPESTLTFENFVIGDSNRMAYRMAVAVAEMPGAAHLNPLFIYGRSGLGKTHLMRAIQNYINETRPELKTVYVDSAELLNDYMEASAAHDKEKSSYKNFKTRYEEANVLLIDDVQYLQGKKQTLDIVFQIFNKLTSQGRQVVLSADRAPRNIDIDDRYKSRFNSGGTFDIQPPEIETKLGIIKSFIDEYRESMGLDELSIPTDVQMYIAENSSSNIRELKSAVTRVIYQMTSFNKPSLTLAEAQALLESHFSGSAAKRLTIADVQKEIEEFYKVSHADLIGKKRSRNITHARQVAIYLCRQLLDLPFNDIGKKFGRDHSTVMYSVSNIEKKASENRELHEELEAIRQIIQDR